MMDSGSADRQAWRYFSNADDFTGSELSGNKIRKLEFLLADALAKGADTVITCGGAQSQPLPGDGPGGC